MAKIRSPYNSFIEVKANSGSDLLQTFNAYAFEREIKIPKGQYDLPSPLAMAEQTTSEPTLLIKGCGRRTIIRDTSGCDTLALLQSAQTAWTINSPKIVLRDLLFRGNNNIYKAINLPFCTVNIEDVRIEGNFKAAGTPAGARKCIYVGGAGSPASVCWVSDLVVIPDNAVYVLAEFWLEGLGGGCISLLNSNADSTLGMRLHGTESTFSKVIGFMGNGKSCTDFISLDGLTATFGSVYINKTGVPTLLPNIFASETADAYIGVTDVQNDAGCVVCKDAQTIANTKVVGWTKP